MKIKSGFILHSMGSEHVVVAVEARTTEFRGMIRLNGTGAFLWQALAEDRTEADLRGALMAEYGIDEALADEAVQTFTRQLRDAGLLDG